MVARDAPLSPPSHRAIDWEPHGRDRFYLWVLAALDMVMLSAALVAGLRIYAVPLVLVVWIVGGIRTQRVRVSSDRTEMKIFNRYRTYTLIPSEIARVELRRTGFRRGPFALSVRLKDESAFTRVRGGVLLEATGSYSDSVNVRMTEIEHFLSQPRKP